MTPRYFVLLDGSMVLCRSISGRLSTFLCLDVKLIRASFEYSRGELCVLDQFLTPLCFLIILNSF